MSVSCKLYKAPPQRWLTSQHNFTFLKIFMLWRLSHVYYERIPFLRLSACTTWFCSVRRPVDVLFEYYQSRKCSWIEKIQNHSFVLQNNPKVTSPVCISKRNHLSKHLSLWLKLTCFRIVNRSTRWARAFLLHNMLTWPGLLVCWQKVPVRVERTVGGQGLALGSLLEAVSPVSGAPCRESERLLDGEYFAVFSWCLTPGTSRYFASTAAASGRRERATRTN